MDSTFAKDPHLSEYKDGIWEISAKFLNLIFHFGAPGIDAHDKLQSLLYV